MRGQIGQNLSYCKEYEPMAHGVIDAAKVARMPEVQADGRVILRVYIGCTEADYGTYTVRVPKAFTGLRLVNGRGSVYPTPTATAAMLQCSVTFTAGNQFTLEFPALTDLTGISILRPGYDAPTTPETGVWTREFVELLKKLNTGVIRSMDWLRTNGSEVTTWDSRCKLVEDERWNIEGKGGPIEPLVQLCNAVGADLWFNVPHLADVSYTLLAAALIKQTLGTGLNVYVEYSNEVWNTLGDIGKATAYCKLMGDSDPAVFDGPNSTVRGRQFYAARLSTVADDFLDAFRGEEHRVRPVLAGQAHYPEQLEWSVDWLKRHHSLNDIHGLAIAPYFGASEYLEHDPEGAVAAAGVEYFFQKGYRYGDPVKDAKGKITGWTNLRTEPGVYLHDRAVAFLRGEKAQRFHRLGRDNNLVRVAYEGNIGCKVKKELADVMRAVIRDGRISEAERIHFDEWFDQGWGVYCSFTAVGNIDHDSTYGAVENINEWGPKAASIALASASRPHPLAAAPVDPRDARIAELEAALANDTTIIANLNYDLNLANAKLANIRQIAGQQ